MIKNFSLFLFLFSISFAHSNAQAKQFSIVAIINDEAISNHMLNDHLNMVIKSSGMQNSLEIRKRLTGQVLNSLINEILQRQNATELDIEITDADLKNAVASLEIKNKLQAGTFPAFLKEQGINWTTFTNQLKNQIAWQRVIARYIRPQIVISDFEVQDAIDQLKSQKSVSEVYVSEIFLPSTDENKQEILELAKSLKQEIQAGGSFSTIAGQFSQGTTASEGGTIGWIPETQLHGKLKEVVSKAQNNSLLEPIFTEDGWRIIKVGNRRVNSPETNNDRLREILKNRKLELEIKRYINDLRKKAFIEVRI